MCWLLVGGAVIMANPNLSLSRLLVAVTVQFLLFYRFFWILGYLEGAQAKQL